MDDDYKRHLKCTYTYTYFFKGKSELIEEQKKA